MKVALLLIALMGAAAVNGLDVVSFQDRLNAQEAAVVTAEEALVIAAQQRGDVVSPILIDQFKQIEQSINNAEGALAAYGQNALVAITNVDNNVDFALAQINSVTASTTDAGAVLSVVKESLCTLAAAIHAEAAKDGVAVPEKTPARCFTDEAPTLLWQVQLNEANAKIVGIQNGLSTKAREEAQALTKIVSEAAAGAGVFSQDKTLGFNQMTSALSKAQVEIAQLLPLLKSKSKQAELQTVNTLLSAVQSSVASYAKDAGVTGTTVPAAAAKPATKATASPKASPKKSPAPKAKGTLSITEAEAPAPAVAAAVSVAGAPAPAPARRLLA